MNDHINYDYTELWINAEALRSLFQGQMTSDGVSSFVIILLFIVFFVFVVKLIWCSIQAVRSASFFQRLLQGLVPENLLIRRQELKNTARRNMRLGKIWNEFDETLVVSADGKELQNTYNAAHFFNTQNLARGITENRLLAAVPGFLTAIGVIGTFTGLVLGLSNIDPENTSSITKLIGGASIAFKTSVWGVVLSLIFNGFEKIVDGYIQNNIVRLQDDIDLLFPRLSPEQTLIYVHEETRKAAITLDSLSERIGNKMQEAVTQVGQQIEGSFMSGLQNILKPALESLVHAANDLADRQARGGVEALETLIQQFTDGIQGQGEQHRTMMQDTTESVTNAIKQWGDSMKIFIEQVKQQNKYWDDREINRSQVLDQHVAASENVVNQGQVLNQQMQSIVQAVQASASEFREGTEFLNSAASGLSTLADRIQGGVNQLDSVLGRVIEQTRELSKENATTGRNVNEVLNILTDMKSIFHTAADTIVQASATACEQTAELTQHQQQLFNTLQEHIRQLQQQISRLLVDYTNQVNSQTQERLNEWNKQTLEFARTMEAAVNAIATVVEEIEDKTGK